MRTDTLHILRDSIRQLPSSLVFQILLAALFLLPLFASLGQFLSSGFMTHSNRFLILFWPGAEWKWAPSAPVWLTMGLMSISYLAGMWYLLRRRTFGRVVLWSIAAVVSANLLGFAVNMITGWRDMQTVASMELTGRVNAAIFSLWQNPVWEELVFRGLPLLVLMGLIHKWPARLRWWELGYILLPNVIFAAYHVPGHGPARLVDSFILGCAMSWLTLRFSLFAPVVIHYFLDAMLVLSLSSVRNVPAEEIPWLTGNSTVLNTTWSLAVLAAIVSPPVLIAIQTLRGMKRGMGETHAI